MKLHYQTLGNGQPLIILHGLFGTLENWGSQIKTLSESFNVIAVDLRNHGRSPHSDEMNYSVMADDVIELMDDLGLKTAKLMGHSMGGKVAMQMALNHAERIQQLIIVDIAPVHYERHHDDVLKGLNTLNLPNIKSRSDADASLAHFISDIGVRAFLLKNLYRNSEKQFAWRMNLPVLTQQYDEISKAPTALAGAQFTKDTLFIKGANSDYLIAEYQAAIMGFFPKASFKIIQGAGHWPHAEKAVAFSRMVMSFLSKE
ncbi:alpha/beta fold hydrolase [Neptunomonas phycophila]|uniref:alpha/beta fold hydrolase n=1 Tax=Neptunomonas phycophila TaxID=1572645 RepID=UPI000948D880|nr:alpha/beta fold hydrolase [Neptunomonas phycophila]